MINNIYFNSNKKIKILGKCWLVPTRIPIHISYHFYRIKKIYHQINLKIEMKDQMKNNNN
jgi:hypothetical protein